MSAPTSTIVRGADGVEARQQQLRVVRHGGAPLRGVMEVRVEDRAARRRHRAATGA